MLNLSPEETIITQFPDKSVVLTSRRISHRYHALGSYFQQHIPLEEITACETYHNTYPWLLVLAALALPAGVFIAPEAWLQGLAAGLAAAGLCLGLYRMTQKKYVIVRSAHTTMAINVKGLEQELVDNFIGKLAGARFTSTAERSTHQAAG